ncbi:amino acid ABC transporter substrate-binding protein, partial [Pseudomonas syringae pv. tagetis]
LGRRESDATVLSVLQSAGAAAARYAPGEQVLREGQHVRLTRNGLGPLLSMPSGIDAWTRGRLVVVDARLGEMLAELGRYRAGR